MRTGGCQCGALRYESAGEPIALYACHCLECRKQVPSAGLRVTRGAPQFWTRSADSGRRLKCAFCPHCGSRVWHQREEPTETITIKAGSLDEPVDFSAAIHIWTSRKLPGMAIPADARQFPQEPD